jgi:ATP-binding cassette subfamily B protein
LGAYLRPEQTWLYQAVFLGVVYTGLGLLTSVFIMLVIDRFIPEADYGRIVFIGIAVLVLQVFRATTAFLRQRFLIELNKRVSIGLAQDFLGRIFRLPARFFDSRKIGDITARLSDSVRIQTTVVQVLGSGIIDGLVIGGSLTALFMISSDLGWVGLAAVPVYAAILLSSRRGIREAQNETVKAYAQVESSYIDSLGGIEDIRAFNVASVFADMTTNLYSRFQGNVEALGKSQVRAVWQAEVAGGLVVMGTLVTGASLVVAGRLALGEMMASYSLLTMMLPSTMRLIEANIALQGASIAATRLLDLLLVEPEPKPGPRPFHMAHRLQIRAGGFTWPRGGRLLKSIELTLERGRLTALWGHTGSGKSTLVKILQRSYALTEGSLWVDDEPADEISLTEWRRNVAVVPQAVKVFNGTLADNILIGRTLQDPVQLAEYVARLGFGIFFDRYPAGLATLVGEEGRQLSSGERQVVGLLRALWDSPAVLVMDEGMNAIDWSTAEMVFRLLRLYAREHAVLLISHNPATVRRADLLYVLSDGSIIDEGRPERPLEDLIAPARVTGQPVAHSIA